MGLLVIVFCLFEVFTCVYVVVDVVEELYQKQIRIAEEEVVAVVLQHIYGFAAIVIAEKILSQPLIVAGQLVVDECEIVVVSRLTKLLCFFQLLDTCFSGLVELSHAHLPEECPCLELSIVAGQIKEHSQVLGTGF